MSETVAVVRATRPNFLILAPLCAGLGLAVAWQQGQPPALLDTLLVFVGALLAHAAVNLLNEYEDFISGLDKITRRTPFSGGSGALPEIPSAARRVLLAGLGTLALVIGIGLYFLWLRGLPMFVLGAAGVVLVLTYTRWITRSPLLCLLAPGIGFGPVMVLGSLIALGAQLDATALVCATVALLLTSELLLINQIPDAEADRQIGRRHLVIPLAPAWRAGSWRPCCWPATDRLVSPPAPACCPPGACWPCYHCQSPSGSAGASRRPWNARKRSTRYWAQTWPCCWPRWRS